MATAYIAYGVPMEEESFFPWDNEDCEIDFDEWYAYNVQGFIPTKIVYDKQGEYLDGMTEKDGSNYIKELYSFQKDNLNPFELHMHCSPTFPMYLLAIRGRDLSADRGYPQIVFPDALVTTSPPQEKTNLLMKFIEEYNLPACGEPNWYLFVFAE